MLEDNTLHRWIFSYVQKRTSRKASACLCPSRWKMNRSRFQVRTIALESKPGCRVFEADRPNMVRVMSPQAAYLMVSMLREVTVSERHHP